MSTDSWSTASKNWSSSASAYAYSASCPIILFCIFYCMLCGTLDKSDGDYTISAGFAAPPSQDPM